MGQYYKPILTDKNGVRVVYNRYVDGERTSAKLTEHSWCGNPFVSTITKKLYKDPHQVVWVGDYSDETHPMLHKYAWKDEDGCPVTLDELYLDGMYLINHTKNQFINYDDYYDRSIDVDGDCLHPLPLLTAIGNGNGGGDYYGLTGQEWIGAWANDLIEVNDVPPAGYTPVMPTFIDSGREPNNIVDIAWDVDLDDVLNATDEFDDNEFNRTFGISKDSENANDIIETTIAATEQAAGILLGLPTGVNAPETLTKNGDMDAITDWLSDKYGFCVKSFKTTT